MAIADIKKGFGGGMEERPKPFEIKQPTPPPATPPPRPKTLFEEKKEWHRDELQRRITKASPYIPGTGGAMYSFQERKEMIEKIFPSERFQSHISEKEAITRLRELREEASRAPETKQLELNRLRNYLERETDLEGKY